jgi:transposase
MLDPGAGKTRKAYVWAYARGELDKQRGVTFEFCLGRGGQYPVAFLSGEDGVWSGTLLTDQYAGYDTVTDTRVYPKRVAAGCVVHARRKYDEVDKAGTSPVAEGAMKRLTQIYPVEGNFAGMPADHRHKGRQELTKPLWVAFKLSLELERRRVPDGSSIAAAIDYSLNHWEQLTRHLDDGEVPLDNNFLERQIKPWQMGARTGSSPEAHSPASALQW